MNSEWLEHLQADGASLLADGAVSFDAAVGVDQLESGALASGAALMDLSALAVVDLQGEDAEGFFQAQVCNDLLTLDGSSAQLNGYCSPKGRLLALFTVFQHAKGYRLVLPADNVQAFVKRLSMYVMRAKVTVVLVDTHVCVGLVTAADTPATIEGIEQLPETVLGVHTSGSGDDALQIVRWHDSPPAAGDANTHRYLLIAPISAAKALWSSSTLPRTGYASWRWADIRAGVPSVVAATADQFIPQMVNLQQLNALSFKKGCYPGQEIVARMQYLGKLKRSMRLFRCSALASVPEPGSALVTDTDNNAGQVVDAIADADGVCLLAVVKVSTTDEQLKVGSVALERLELPYKDAQEDTEAAADA